MTRIVRGMWAVAAVLAVAASTTKPACGDEVAEGAGEAQVDVAALLAELEASKELIRKKDEELKMAGTALREASKRAQDMHDASSMKVQSANENNEASQASCDAKIKASEEKSKGLEKRLEAAQQETKRAMMDAGKAQSSCEDSRKFEEETMRLRKEIAELKSSGKDCSKPLEELKRELEREKARHDEETARLKASADENAESLWMIAMRRGSVHANLASEQLQEFYEKQVVPGTAQLSELSQQKLEELKILAGPQWDAFEQATVPARVWLFEQLDAVQPVYDEHAKPHVEKFTAAASDLADEAPKKMRSFHKEAEKQFYVFRERAIQTVRRNKMTEENAEVLIDAALVAVAFISAYFLTGPVIGLVIAFAVAILLLPFRLIACILCCGCCRSSRRAAPKTPQPRQSAQI
ncbi:Hypothetical Protein FCC1311_020042 [Hondaea fermentalgiana]|uniref:Uncharacterized protein n=1 Tax=Hondaea fermentalgiana TaxID=2315210 RepID=A0A2R5G5G8_9STRA|nr:Hypothetical Protein FCC1311_020042 [Hondaea fermentalgiana]|eukprot:GBG25785.1 Hypothetical Protein FCC1311_020042 [Hondaea fermentalgiana]